MTKDLTEKLNAVLESNENLFKTIQVLKKRLVDVTEENAKLKELLKNVTDECDIEKQKALLKINQLAKLLKECREIFNRTAYTYKFDMVAKIDEVLK